MTSPGLEKLKAGDFNTMNQARQPDKSVIIILSKRGEGKRYKLHVKDLYGPAEEVLSEEVLEVPRLNSRRDEL